MYTCCITTSLFYCVFIVNVFADVATAEIMELSCQDVKLKTLNQNGYLHGKVYIYIHFEQKTGPFFI